MLPENVFAAVGVKIVRANNTPTRREAFAISQKYRTKTSETVHKPQSEPAIDTLPEEIGLAIVIEIAVREKHKPGLRNGENVSGDEQNTGPGDAERIRNDDEADGPGPRAGGCRRDNNPGVCVLNGPWAVGRGDYIDSVGAAARTEGRALF